MVEWPFAEYANLLIDSDALDSIRGAIVVSSAADLVAACDVFTDIAPRFRDAQSCRIVELLAHILEKGSSHVSPKVRLALRDIVLARTSNLLEAAALSSAVFPFAYERHSIPGDFLEFLRQYLKRLADMKPSFSHSKRASRAELLEALMCIFHCAPSALATQLSLQQLHDVCTSVTTSLLAIFKAEKDPENLHFLFTTLFRLRLTLLFCRCGMYVARDIVPGILGGAPAIDLPEERLTAEYVGTTSDVLGYLFTYMPISFVPLPNMLVSQKDVNGSIFRAIFLPCAADEFYGLVCERFLDVDTADEKRTLFTLLAAALSCNQKLQVLADCNHAQSISDSLKSAVLSGYAAGATAEHAVAGSFISVFGALLSECVYTATPEELRNSELYSEMDVFFRTHGLAAFLATLSVSSTTDTNRSSAGPHEGGCPSPDAVAAAFLSSKFLRYIVSDATQISLSPEGFTQDLYYQISSELIYDQFPEVQAVTEKCIELLSNDPNGDVCERFSFLLEDAVKRELLMGSSENMKIRQGTLNMTIQYSKSPVGCINVIRNLLPVFARSLPTADNVDASLYLHILESVFETILTLGSEAGCIAAFWSVLETRTEGSADTPLIKILVDGISKHSSKFGLGCMQKLVLVAGTSIADCAEFHRFLATCCANIRAKKLVLNSTDLVHYCTMIRVLFNIWGTSKGTDLALDLVKQYLIDKHSDIVCLSFSELLGRAVDTCQLEAAADGTLTNKSISMYLTLLRSDTLMCGLGILPPDSSMVVTDFVRQVLNLSYNVTQFLGHSIIHELSRISTVFATRFISVARETIACMESTSGNGLSPETEKAILFLTTLLNTSFVSNLSFYSAAVHTCPDACLAASALTVVLNSATISEGDSSYYAGFRTFDDVAAICDRSNNKQYVAVILMLIARMQKPSLKFSHKHTRILSNVTEAFLSCRQIIDSNDASTRETLLSTLKSAAPFITSCYITAKTTRAREFVDAVAAFIKALRSIGINLLLTFLVYGQLKTSDEVVASVIDINALTEGLGSYPLCGQLLCQILMNDAVSEDSVKFILKAALNILVEFSSVFHESSGSTAELATSTSSTGFQKHLLRLTPGEREVHIYSVLDLVYVIGRAHLEPCKEEASHVCFVLRSLLETNRRATRDKVRATIIVWTR